MNIISGDRVKRYRLRQKELGRLKREMYLTDDEFKSLKGNLSELRKSNLIKEQKND